MKIKGNYIKQLILRKAMTQQEFADHVGLTRSSLNTMLNRNKCNVISLKKISRGLDVEPEEILQTMTDEEKEA